MRAGMTALEPDGSTMPAQTDLFLCLKDNYGVLLHDPETGATASIDAPEAAPVEAALARTGWRLTDILVTHHHGDHTAGIAELKARHHCRVVAPRGEAARIPHVDETVAEGDTVRVGTLEGRVIETPGHTAGHISYFFPADKLAFVGDTLFSIGCGRVIEGDPGDDVALAPQAARPARRHRASIAATNTPPPISVSPRPSSRTTRRSPRATRRSTALVAAHKPTIPATIAAEKADNPFLRADAARSRRSRSGSPAARPGRCSPKSANARISF